MTKGPDYKARANFVRIQTSLSENFMARLQPLPPETTPELKDHFDFFLGTLGFTPNSVLTMQRKPKLVQAFAQLNGAVMDPAGEVDLGFRRLIGHVVSKVAGCLYCQAHTLLGAANFGVTDAKLADVKAKYEKHVATMLGMTGHKDPAGAAKAIVALETALAEVQ